MKYYKIPREYLFIVMLFFLSSFFPFFLLTLKNEFKWWAMDFTQLKLPQIMTFSCFMIFTFLLLKKPNWGRRWFLFYSFNLILFFILEINKTPTASLMIFFVLFLAFLLKIYQFIVHYLRLPSTHLGLNWFHGVNSFSPHLKTEIHTKDLSYPFITSSLSSNGLSGFVDDQHHISILETQNDFSIQLKFKESAVKIRTQLICSFQNKLSSHSLIFGLKFKRLKPDEEKDLSDFLEILRGEGYEC